MNRINGMVLEDTSQRSAQELCVEVISILENELSRITWTESSDFLLPVIVFHRQNLGNVSMALYNNMG